MFFLSFSQQEVLNYLLFIVLCLYFCEAHLHEIGA